ncbi:MAG: threonine synthase [Saprospiraceae bacterium]|nr:threonine synthase [Saprospiraceae bacterium]
METLIELKSLYTDLICSKTGKIYDKNQLQTYSDLNKPLIAQYDLLQGVDRDLLQDRPRTMWRYREVLPIENDKNIVSLGEGMTPVFSLQEVAKKLGLDHLYLKDEAYNPTGSFKARGLSMAISKAKELGVKKCVIPTAGNAGGAMSAYCAKAGLEAYVFMPVATPEVFRKECEYFGAKVTLVNGSIRDCAMEIAKVREPDWFDISTLKEPFRLEGKKTMGYEIAEQFGWELPDVIIYPTGGGTGLIGIWKAFDEMERLGWIGSKRPRMVAVQTEACYPIVKAFQENKSIAEPFQDPEETIANGLRVPAAFGDELILQALYESHGTAVAVSEQAMLDGLRELAQTEGMLISPEGAAVWAACKKLVEKKWIQPWEEVVLLNTGSVYKYMENL